MALINDVLNPLTVLLVVGLVGRATVRLLTIPEESHEELVPVCERRATTALGIPLALVGLSTLSNGPLAVPAVNPGALSILGVVLFTYPNFVPSSL